ncbi:glycoside hydrolase family 2 TIM barrel-domain containing protein [Hirschia litorea]|uniref:Glycoside hydrolase family 2 TIM barrel-domain containing protein n=1 Tax=Hirschia litorea TaxID=1199156 RepID=A0ABW2IPF1_9PROT
MTTVKKPTHFIALSCVATLLLLGLGACSKNVPASPSSSSPSDIGQLILANDGWKFTKLPTLSHDDTQLHTISFDDSNWSDARLPHTANIEPLLVNDQWQGISWYRKHFTIEPANRDKKVIFKFEAAMNYAQFWINGEKITEHQGGYLPIVFDATDYINFDGENVIAVRLDNTDNEITGPKPLKILDFNMYGGLYRNAFIAYENPVHISYPQIEDTPASGGIFITFPKVDADQSTVRAKVHVKNDNAQPQNVSVIQSIYQGDKRIAQSTSSAMQIHASQGQTFQLDMPIEKPHLWSPRTPHLYTLKTQILVDGNQVDYEKTRFGIRDFTFKDNDLYINGEKTFLRGVNRHQEYPFVGYALSDAAQYRDAKKIKEAGFDYIRLSHYPQSPAFLDACDELGLVVLDAVLGWQYYQETPQFKQQLYRTARDLIRRDRNHPSVLAWEVSINETKMPIPFMEEMHKIVKEEYPEGNAYSAGWMNEVYDIYLQARQHRLRHYDKVQAKPYSVSEYGDWEYYSSNKGFNQHNWSKDERAENNSRQRRGDGEAKLLQQARNMQESHNDNLQNTPAFSDSYWVMYDYNRGYHPDIEASGVMDIFRLPKFGYYFYASQRSPDAESNAEPILKIASLWTPDSTSNVKVFSNVDEVELFLNGKSIGKQTPDTDSISTHLPHPPFTFQLDQYESGTLSAIGYIGGKAVAEDKVSTPTALAGLKLALDTSGQEPTQNDVLFVYIHAIDANGTTLASDNSKLDFKIDGDATLMNPDAITFEAGIATALIRTGQKGGKITLTATHENAHSASLDIITKQ